MDGEEHMAKNQETVLASNSDNTLQDVIFDTEINVLHNHKACFVRSHDKARFTKFLGGE